MNDSEVDASARRAYEAEYNAAVDSKDGASAATAWDGTVDSAWAAALNYAAGCEGDSLQVMADIIRFATDAQRWSKATPVSESAKPDTLEKCWECIRYLDVEIAGAMDDYQRVKRELKSAQEKLAAFEKCAGAVGDLIEGVFFFSINVEDPQPSEEELERLKDIADTLRKAWP